jgi:hypothetical protein
VQRLDRLICGIVAMVAAQAAVERELVLRLASLLWRLRRATTIETGRFEIQADYLNGFREAHQVNAASQEALNALFWRAEPVSFSWVPTSRCGTNSRGASLTPTKICRSRPRSYGCARTVLFARCQSPPTSRSVGSADVNRPSDAKSARARLRSVPWIAANLRNDGVVSMSVAGRPAPRLLSCRSPK